MADNKCKGCTERTLGCHSRCEYYKSYREDIEVQKTIDRDDRVVDGYITDRWYDTKRKAFVRRRK